jgi:hypothetical protein
MLNDDETFDDETCVDETYDDETCDRPLALEDFGVLLEMD